MTTVLDMKIAMEQFTPQDAQELLDNNPLNRTIRPSVVSHYAADMLAGLWVQNGEAIKISHDGALLDGQHRLSAQIRAGLTLSWVVVRGLPSESQASMDLGVGRQLHEQAEILGIKATREEWAALTYFKSYVEDGMKTRGTAASRPTQAQMTTWVKENPDILALIQSLNDDLRPKRMKGVKPSLLLAAAAVFSLIDENDAKDFFEGLLSGTNLKPGSPILALRNRLQRILSERESITELERWGYYITAWNAFRQGNIVTRVQTPRGGFKVKNFPTPI